jgi:ubiquinol-cytochrome c reductase iron-sulfur subunit
VCPCHYSTFDVRRGGAVMFGPAGRPLPQLPLRINARRELVADGDFFDGVGPSWSGVRQKGTRT